MRPQAAYSFKLGLCEDQKCRVLHFVLEDDQERSFAEMTVGVEYVPRLIKRMQDLAYEIETTRKDY